MEMTFNESSAPAKRDSAKRFGGRSFIAGMAILGVLVVIGIALWIVQLSGGMVQTGMRNLDSWGLYIICFMFFVGLSAGGLIISSIPNALGIEGFGGVSKVAIWTAICSTVAAVGFIIVDLGNPTRIWELFVFANFSSPLLWDVLVISTYFVLSCLYLWMHLRYEAGKISHAAIRIVSVIALVVAVGVHTVTAWIFSLGPAHEFWNTALMGPWFVSSALVCGTALVIVVVSALRRVGYLALEERYITRMAKMLGVFVCVDLYFFACDLLTSGYFGGEGSHVVEMLVSGQLAPFFWVQIIACVACAISCFAPRLRVSPALIVGALLAIVGIFCKRVQILVGGFQIANIDLAGVVTDLSAVNASESFADVYEEIIYWPTLLECGVAVGVIALAVLLMLIGLRYLNLRPAERDV